MPALLVKLSYYAHIMLTSLSVLCIYACAVCVAMSDIDTDGAIIELFQLALWFQILPAFED